VIPSEARFGAACLPDCRLVASFADVAVVASLALGGVLMSPLPLSIVALLLATTIGFTLGMDSLKLAVLSRLRID